MKPEDTKPKTGSSLLKTQGTKPKTVKKSEGMGYKIMHFVLLVVILALFSQLSIDAIIMGAALIYVLQVYVFGSGKR